MSRVFGAFWSLRSAVSVNKCELRRKNEAVS